MPSSRGGGPEAEPYSTLILASGKQGEFVVAGLGKEHAQERVVERVARFPALEARDERGTRKGHVADRVGHDLRYAIDPTVMFTELDWKPEHTDFEEGLRVTIQWYRENESWWGPLKDAVEAGYARFGQ